MTCVAHRNARCRVRANRTRCRIHVESAVKRDRIEVVVARVTEIGLRMSDTNIAARVRARYTTPIKNEQAEHAAEISRAGNLLKGVASARVDAHFEQLEEGAHPYPREGLRTRITLFNPAKDFSSGNEPDALPLLHKMLGGDDREATLASTMQMLEAAGFTVVSLEVAKDGRVIGELHDPLFAAEELALKQGVVAVDPQVVAAVTTSLRKLVTTYRDVAQQLSAASDAGQARGYGNAAAG